MKTADYRLFSHNLQFRIKLMGRSKRIKQKRKEPKYFDICFSIILPAMTRLLLLEESGH